MKLVYLIPTFPSQTHINFWREITAHRNQGVEVFLVSTRPPSSDCGHLWAPAAKAETTYLLPPDLSTVAAAFMNPMGCLRAVGYSAGLKESTIKQRAVAGGGSYLAATKLLKFCKRSRIDHVHVHSCATSAHIAAQCRRMGGPPYSLTLHGDLDVYGKDHGSKMAGAAFVSVVTRPLQKEVHERVKLPLDRLPVITCGVDTSKFCPLPKRERVSGKLHLLTVSRLNRTKGHVHALAAVRSLVDQGLNITYTIAGEGPERRPIEDKIQEMGLASRVNLTGSVGEHQVLELMQASDVFVLPSYGLGEAAPLAVMEAMSCGVPVVCSIIGGTPDMITTGVDGILVAQQDEAGLASAFEVLATDLDLFNQISQAARNRALNDFDYMLLGKRLLEEMTRRLPQKSIR